MSKSAYDLGSNGGLSKLKKILTEHIKQNEERPQKSDSPYAPKRIPSHANI